ncbi:MAG: DNA translocase FtsK [bacterium]
MSKNKNKEKNTGKTILFVEISAAISLLSALFLWISLSAYEKNLFGEKFITGKLGFEAAHNCSVFFGYASYFIPIIIGIIIFMILYRKLWPYLIMNLLVFISLMPFFHFIDLNPLKWNYPGGWLGKKGMEELFMPYLGFYGTTLFFILVFIVYTTLTLRTPVIFETLKKTPAFGKIVKKLFSHIFSRIGNIQIFPEKPINRKNKETEKFSEKISEKEISEKKEESKEEKNEVVVKSSKKTDKTKVRRSKKSSYKIPPISLLSKEENIKDTVEQKKHVTKTAGLIESKLMQHNVEVSVKEVTIGPVVTMYELALGKGVKVSQVHTLEQDIAVVVGGKQTRVVPRLSGRPYIGIEVPNHIRLVIKMRSILESEKFCNHIESGLPMVLGKKVDGTPIIADLTAMPHLLVAGTTGSGKSVGLNAFITSLLFTYSPYDVQFLMIDPKGNEFNVYENIPHLLMPVVVDSKKAALTVKWAVNEMEERFRKLSENYVRDISSYNKKVEEINKNLKNKEQHLSKMPYIVIVIDEFADLMMVAGKDVEMSVTRIAQKARAVGIHLIIATQRPTRDVITGLIKGNLPVRIAFRVASAIDSRTILDKNGAEKLLGKGDMLYIPPGSSEPERVHGAFISTSEAKKVVSFIRENTECDTSDSSFTAADSPEKFVENSNAGMEKENSDDVSEDEPLWNEIIEYIKKSRKCSASRLQRKFKIGYNRAARIVEDLEEKGYVGPPDGSKPREVLLPREDK